MSKWKLGYLVGPNELMPAFKTALAYTGSGVSANSMEAGTAALKCTDVVMEYTKETQRMRDLVYKRINEIDGISLPNKPEGAATYFPNVSEVFKDSDEAARSIMREAHVAVNSGLHCAEGPPAEGHLRICVATEPYERLCSAMDRLEQAFKKFRAG
jgi:aspartate/methionine/tyrosine aminotransferase